MLAFPHEGLCPGPLFRLPEQRASDADRDTAVDFCTRPPPTAVSPWRNWMSESGAVLRSLLGSA
jgi:hypothetical protein